MNTHLASRSCYVKLTLIVTCLFTCSILLGQETLDQNSELGYQPQIPPSPEASSLGTYGNHDVNLYYGRPSVSIPLFTIQHKDLTLPISLTYSSTGHRVKDEGSWVGLGWTLQGATMSVSRTVMGLVDEKAMDNLLISDPWFLDSDLDPHTDKLQLAANGMNWDTQPDVFSYTIPGYSGQFVLGKNAKVIMTEFQPVEIQPLMTGLSNGADISAFTIRDPNGITYTFSEIERTQPGLAEKTTYPDFNSAWHIKKIEKGSSEISFEYFNAGRRIMPFQVSESMTYQTLAGTYSNTAGLIQTPSVYTILDEKRVSKIKFGLDYADISPAGINVFIDDRQVHNIDFAIPLFEKSSDCEQDFCRRKKLTRVVVNGNEYKMEYEDIPQPPVNSYDLDHWGFYNGAGNNSAVPNIQMGNQSLGGGANREINLSYNRFGMLKQITYPTGGYSVFNYEQNSVYQYNEATGKFKLQVNEKDTYTLISDGSSRAPVPPFSANWPKQEQIVIGDGTVIQPGAVSWVDQIKVSWKYTTALSGGGPEDYVDEPFVEFHMNGDRLIRDVYCKTASNCPQQAQSFNEDVEYRVSQEYFTPTNQTHSGQVILSTCGDTDNRVEISIERQGHAWVRPSDVDFIETIMVGGLRIQSIENYNVDNKLLNKKIFSYRDGIGGPTSGKLINGLLEDLTHKSVYFSTYGVETSGFGCAADFYPNKLVVTNNSGGRLVSGDPIGYERVTEKMVDSLGNNLGYTVYKYKHRADNYPTSYPRKPNVSNSHLRGQLVQKEYFNHSHALLKKEINTYSSGGSFDTFSGAVIVKDRESPSNNGCVHAVANTDKYTWLPYSYNTSSLRLKTSVVEEYFGSDTISTITGYEYDDDNRYELLKSKTTKRAAGNTTDSVTIEYTYDYEVNSASNYPSNVREERVLRNGKVVRGRHLTYLDGHPTSIRYWKGSEPDVSFTRLEDGTRDDGYEGANDDNQVYTDVNISYASPGMPSRVIGTDGLPTYYVWDTHSKSLLAKVDNCFSQDQLAFETFDGPSFNSLPPLTAQSGNKAGFTGDGYLVLGASETDYLAPGRYVLEFWLKNEAGSSVSAESHSSVGSTKAVEINAVDPGSDWIHYKGVVDWSELASTASFYIRISGAGKLDEIRVYPDNALMTTIQHEYGIGVTSQVDPAGNLSHFEYDHNNRLTFIRDQDDNVLKAYLYVLKGSLARELGTNIPTMNFGPVDVGMELTKYLTISNTGDEPMEIFQIELPSGYSSDFTSGLIPPNGSIDLPVTLRPINPVAYDGQMIIHANHSAGNNQVDLIGSGSTRILELSGSTAFGDVIHGTSEVKTLKLRNTGTKVLNISGLSFDHPDYSINWGGGDIMPGSSRDVQISYQATQLGSTSAELTINSNLTHGESQLQYSGSGYRVEMQMNQVLSFDPVELGAEHSKTVTITNLGNRPLFILSASFSSGSGTAFSSDIHEQIAGLSNTEGIAPGESSDYTINYNPTEHGPHHTVFSINTNETHAVAGSGTLTINGNTYQRIINVTGDLAFGNRGVNISTTKSIRISNSGNSVLSVSHIEVPNGISVDWSGGDISAGSYRDVDVIFEPTTGGVYSGSVVVHANETSGTAAKTISGFGVSRVIRLSGASAFGEKDKASGLDTRTLTIENTGTGDLSVSSISHSSSLYTGNWSGTIAPFGSQEVTITFHPDEDGEQNNVLMVNANSTSGQTTLSYTAFVNSRQFQVTAGNGVFGNQELNSTTTRTIQISNTGNRQLTILSQVLASPYYTTNIGGNDAGGNYLVRIPAGNTYDLEVHFSPTNANAAYDATLYLMTDATNSEVGSHSIALSGGVATRDLSLSGSTSFGDRWINTNLNRTLTITNSGNSTLNVSGISLPSDYTANWSGGNISAGGSKNVTITFRPTSGGDKNGTITINSNKTSGVETKSITGFGKTKTIKLSGNMAFGDVAVNTSKNKTLKIENTGNRTLTINGLTLPNNYTANWTNGTIAAGSHRNVTITFQPTSEGSQNGTINVASNKTDGTNTRSTTGFGIRRAISLSGNLDFGNVNINSSKEQTLTISNTGNSTMTINSISVPGGYTVKTATPATITAGSSKNFTIAFKPTSYLTGYNGAISVSSNKTEGINTSSVSGEVRTRIINITGNMSFGNRTVNSSTTRTLSIQNTGNNTLTVNGITLPSAYSANWTSGTIVAGATKNVTITFQPTSGGSKDGSIIVNSNNTGGFETKPISGFSQTRVMALSGNLGFGDVVLNQSSTRTLTLKNNGNSTLTISSINLPSGDYTASWSGGTIAAGASRNVTITFQPTSNGSKNGSITVSSNKTSGGNSRSVSGTGVSRVVALSGNLSFGNREKNSTTNKSFTISNNGNRALTIFSITAPDGYIVVYPTDMNANMVEGELQILLDAGASLSFTLRYEPTAFKSYNGTVTIDSDKTSGTNTRSVSGGVKTRVMALSGNMAFGTRNVNTSKTSTLSITNNGNTTLSVSSISIPAHYSVNWSSGTIAAGETKDVTVTFRPTSGGNKNGTITVNSNKTAGTNTRSVTGFARTRTLQLTGSFSYGEVSKNTSATRTLEIKNTGNRTLTVTDISVPSHYSADWTSGTIASGATRNVTITFRPTSLGAKNGTITVSSNKTSGSNTKSVTGKGVTRIIALSGDLDFGTANVTAPVTKTLTITNNGTGTLNVSGIAATTDPIYFRFNWTSGSIAPGASKDVSVTFDPGLMAVWDGIIKVYSNKSSGTDTIDAQGTAVGSALPE